MEKYRTEYGIEEEDGNLNEIVDKNLKETYRKLTFSEAEKIGARGENIIFKYEKNTFLGIAEREGYNEGLKEFEKMEK